VTTTEARPPFQPKRFYRELDRLLGEVEGGGLYAEWFPWIVSEIVTRFGPALSIERGRLFEEHDGEFVDVQSAATPAPPHFETDDPTLRLVRKHGVYLFDGTAPDLGGTADLGRPDTAGFAIESDPPRVVAFRLRPGWVRDDVDFALNTIRNAIQDRMSFQTMKVDLEQAAEIQRSLLPAAPPPFPGYTLAARSIPAARVGGDFYDFLPLDPETLVLAVGDASGHGLSAALLARDVVTGLRMGTERALKITDIMNRLNRVIARSILSTRFVSLFFGELEANGNVFYVNAGHHAPWLFGDRGIRRLTLGGTILGPLETSTFKRGFAHVDQGDTLVVVSDGVLERTDDSGEPFGEEGVERVVSPIAGAPAGTVLEKLFAAALAHGQGRHWTDDTTVVVVSRERKST
jgi:sigma-B regulation protein RsbU (phosphoserine phosphatase)